LGSSLLQVALASAVDAGDMVSIGAQSGNYAMIWKPWV
jgi:hypothetical protein